MTRSSWGFIVAALALVAATVIVASANRSSHASDESQSRYVPTATIKDLMDSLVDPSADVVWNAVATTVGAGGPTDKVPQTDEEWADVRNGAIRLVEAANLLAMPGRHVARPGEKSETPGVELEPSEMEALVNKDPVAWANRVQAFRAATVEALQAAEARDPNKLFEVGDRIDTACESCHRQYWYPNEKIPDLPSEKAPAATTGASE